eukprot:1176345-Prorocentrum_minimum.AAC.3
MALAIIAPSLRWDDDKLRTTIVSALLSARYLRQIAFRGDLEAGGLSQARAGAMDMHMDVVPHPCAMGFTTSPGYEVLHVVLDAMNIARGYKEYINAPEGSPARISLNVEALRLCFDYFHRSGVCAKAFAAMGFIELRPSLRKVTLKRAL